MSAGGKGEYPGEQPITIFNAISELAPGMQAPMIAAIEECHTKGIDALVHETFRSNRTQGIYYARGRTQIPPSHTVTNAKTNDWSWHGYRLAADIISASQGWDAKNLWFATMGAIFEKHGFKWGGRWKHPDMPHIQFGGCPDSPSDLHRSLLHNEGIEATWRAVGCV